MKRLLLASNNQHKAFEFKEKFKASGLDLELMIPKEISSKEIDVLEDGLTLEDNSEKKAVGFFKAFGITTIADDTGLEITALNGRPGVNSARFSGIHGNDKANREKALYELENKSDRSAQFRTVLCMYDGMKKLFFNGICKGTIIESEKGENGFGYDSIFVPDGFNKTFAQLSSEEKNNISHRAKAIENFTKFLSEIKK